MIVREVELSDASAIADIYNHYINTTVITFEEEPVDETDMAARISGIKAKGLPWFLAEDDGEDSYRQPSPSSPFPSNRQALCR